MYSKFALHVYVCVCVQSLVHTQLLSRVQLFAQDPLVDFLALLGRCSNRCSATAAAKSLQSCPTLCDPTGGSPAGSPVPRTLQARTLERVAISFSNASKWKVKVKSLSHAQLFVTPCTAAYQAPPSMGFSRQDNFSGVPSSSPNRCSRSLEISKVMVHILILAW